MISRQGSAESGSAVAASRISSSESEISTQCSSGSRSAAISAVAEDCFCAFRIALSMMTPDRELQSIAVGRRRRIGRESSAISMRIRMSHDLNDDTRAVVLLDLYDPADQSRFYHLDDRLEIHAG